MFSLPVNIIKALKSKPCDTFLGEYEGQLCVVKFLPEEASYLNEYAILLYMQEYSNHPEWYPKPYLQFRVQLDEYVIKLGDQEHSVYDIDQVIIYEYFPGDAGLDLAKSFDIDKARKDLTAHLTDIHNMGVIVADIHHGNIIYNTKLQRYQLIDYGMAFRPQDTKFLPSISRLDGELSTREDDLADLEISIRVIEGIRYSVCSKYDIGMILFMTLKSFSLHLEHK